MDVAFLGLAHVHLADHLDVVATHPHLRLVAAWDRERRRPDSLPADVFTDDLAAAVERAELVVIASTTVEHAELVPLAATAGRAVFVEKPLGRNAEETRQLAALVQQAGVPAATGFFLRFLPALVAAREAVEAGRLGWVHTVRASFGHAGLLDGTFDGDAAWMLDQRRAGMGGFGDLGIHLLDAVAELRRDADLHVLSAAMDPYAGLGVESGGKATLSWSDGARATVTAGWATRRSGLSVVLQGSQGVARITDGTLVVQDLNGPRICVGEAPDARRALQAFADSLTGHEVPRLPGPVAALRTAELLEQAYATAAAPPARRPARGSERAPARRRS